MARQYPYEQVAQEYYGDGHATCRSFEDATESFLAENKGILNGVNTNGTLLDAGSGAGMTPRYLGEITGRLFQLDVSSTMLQQAEGSRIRGDALKLPFADGSFDAVTAFLYDPFNVTGFEKEVVRVLKPKGTFLGTLPSFEWANTFRYAQDFRNTEHTNDTYFTLQDGTRVKESSRVSRDEETRYRLWMAGFDTVETYGISASYAGMKLARPIHDTAWLHDDRKPFERLNIVTVVKAMKLDKARRDFGTPPRWLREVVSF